MMSDNSERTGAKPTVPACTGWILLVEDERANRRSLATILQLQGYRVESAASGEEALERVARLEGGVDVALLDLKLPGMDGLEVMRRLRELDSETQVILLTGHGSLQSAIEALQNGANDYLLKPCAPSQILESIQKRCAERQRLRQRGQLLDEVERSTGAIRALLGGAAGYSGAAGAGSKVPEAAGRQPHLSADQISGIRLSERAGQAGGTQAGGAQAGGSHLQVDTKPLGLLMIFLQEGLVFDVMRREIRSEKQRVNLTRGESRLLKALAEQPGKVSSHQQLANIVQGHAVPAWEAADMLRPLVSRLRQKLSKVGGDGWVVSVRGSGYVLDLEKH